MVPQLVICQKCDAVLYEGEELKAPSDIIESHDGKCPTCGKKLSYIPIDFKVKPFEKTNQLSPLETEKTIKKKESEKTQRKAKEKGIRKLRTEIREHLEQGGRVDWTFALIVERG